MFAETGTPSPAPVQPQMDPKLMGALQAAKAAFEKSSGKLSALAPHSKLLEVLGNQITLTQQLMAAKVEHREAIYKDETHLEILRAAFLEALDGYKTAMFESN